MYGENFYSGTKPLYAIQRNNHIKMYNVNNTGRDTYIYDSHGGFTMLNGPVKWPEVGSI